MPDGDYAGFVSTQAAAGEHDAHLKAKAAAPGAIRPTLKATKASESPIVFECDFGPTTDRNYDGWPDGWTRRHGAGFHEFLKIAIAEDKSDAKRGSTLFFDMNGGSAEVGSPRISITPSFSYVLEGECRLTELVHDDAKVTLTFLSSMGKSLLTCNLTFSGQAAAGQWQGFHFDPVTPPPQTSAATISLQVAPHNARQDLRGQAASRHRSPPATAPHDDSYRQPSSTSSPAGRTWKCAARFRHSSCSDDSRVRALLDHEGRCLDRSTRKLTSGQDALAGATWTPAFPGFGFYRVVSTGGDRTPRKSIAPQPWPLSRPPRSPKPASSAGRYLPAKSRSRAARWPLSWLRPASTGQNIPSRFRKRIP